MGLICIRCVYGEREKERVKYRGELLKRVRERLETNTTLSDGFYSLNIFISQKKGQSQLKGWVWGWWVA